MNSEGKERVAVCPGSYDPVTNGHIDILKRTSRVFDRVVVGVVGQSIRKSSSLFTPEERKGFLERAIAEAGIENVEVKIFSNLLVEFVREQNGTAIVKGLRAISDFEYEFEMNQLNRKLAPDIESVYIFASSEFSFLSSTGVKEMATFGGDVSISSPERSQWRSQKGLSDDRAPRFASAWDGQELAGARRKSPRHSGN